jgi:ankyrin repeat protein
LQKNVAFVKQWLSQNPAFKPDLEDYFEERFAYAGWMGDVKILKDLDSGHVGRVLQRGQNSMLIYALANMHIEFTETVLDFKSTNHYDFGTNIWTGLFTLVNGDPVMVRLLARTKALLSPGFVFLAAACPKNLHTIKTLAELEGINLKAVLDEKGLTAMHYAARVPNVETLQYLKKKGLDIDAQARSSRKCRPVHESAAFGHVENIRWFKEAGARITEPDGYGRQLMHVAAENGRLGVMRYLQDIGESLFVWDKGYNTPLHSAARGGHVDVVRYLVEKGLDVNAAADGWTPLHYATSWNRPEVVRLLVWEYGASLSLTIREGLTAFDIAMNDGRRQLANLGLRPPSPPPSLEPVSPSLSYPLLGQPRGSIFS